ncbi:MAG: hypothetical protein OEW87_14415, partial [Flavobacteriaceae bacterium]|nr:hypothetical protein [Flavobacteriaceae bacterium]
MNIVGINAYHGDSSACLIKDGVVVAAVEEERFTRIKHWAGLPLKAIVYCLEEGGLKATDIDCFSVNINPNASIAKKIGYVLTGGIALESLVKKVKDREKKVNLLEDLKRGLNLENHDVEIEFVDHHIAHLYSSLITTSHEETLFACIDGFGDFKSAIWGFSRGFEIEIDKTIYFPHSLGIFYQAVTQFIGFNSYGDEYKVMGLAPYGRYNYPEEMAELVSVNEEGEFRLDTSYFTHTTKDFKYTWKGGKPDVSSLYSKRMLDLMGENRSEKEELTQRHKDIAHSAQKKYEEVFLGIVNSLYKKYGASHLCLSGGCAMNSVANGKVRENTKIKSVTIQPAAGDAGGSVGAAYYTYVKSANKKLLVDTPYLGPRFTMEQIETLLSTHKSELIADLCEIELLMDDQLIKSVVSGLLEGKVVGWFQGRMEWGPRALGNRSILADPRRTDMKDILNSKIKRRESFRPFAPSILREHVSDWFDQDDDVPYMMKVYKIRESKRADIPAVTHVDGTGRLQTVSKEMNEKYYKLIQAFYEKTSVPILLNTSFNENEPIVCTPKQALDCFLRTKMDILVLENY